MNNNSLFSLLDKNEVKTIINIFKKEGIDICLVGGCVRNAILNRQINDIDCAVNAKPNFVVKILKKNNIKFKDFAIQYGLVTAFIENQKFEITSLRRDVNQQGRHTEIEYTDDWKIDAERRDFTINAIYLTSDGKLLDFFDGLKNLQECKVKFIGNIEQRVKEDFIRILRYYRFLGIFQKPKIIPNYESFLQNNFMNIFQNLSNEIIRVEILKMLKNPFPINSFSKIANPKQKNYWLQIVNKHFSDQNYNLGLESCLNKVNEYFIK